MAPLSEGKAATATTNGSAIYQLCSPAALFGKGQLTLFMIFVKSSSQAFHSLCFVFGLVSFLGLLSVSPLLREQLHLWTSLLKVEIWVFAVVCAVHYLTVSWAVIRKHCLLSCFVI